MGTAAKTKVTLGWVWHVILEDDKWRADPAPIGALLRINEGLKLTRSSLKSGTLLRRTTLGWNPITADEAAKFLKSNIAMKGDQLQQGSFPDRQETAILSAAALRQRGKDLIEALEGLSLASGFLKTHRDYSPDVNTWTTGQVRAISTS